MSPPPNFPYQYGMVGPLLTVNATAPVNAAGNEMGPDTPATEMTTVSNSFEAVDVGKSGVNETSVKIMN